MTEADEACVALLKIGLLISFDSFYHKYAILSTHNSLKVSCAYLTRYIFLSNYIFLMKLISGLSFYTAMKVLDTTWLHPIHLILDFIFCINLLPL